MYPSLAKSYKGAFPFKLGTTSFIYPDHYVPNVEMLGPYLDEIELLLFESLPPDALPSKAVIRELSLLAQKYDLTYNVHLPTDVSISDPKPEKQKRAIDTYVKIIDLLSPLRPTAYALHIPFSENSPENGAVETWQSRAHHNLEIILAAAIAPQFIALETLDYPLGMLDGIVDDLDLALCLDLGHLMVDGYDIKTAFHTYCPRTSIIHLHGYHNRQDHLSLNRLPADSIEPVFEILKKFTGSLSLEVFSFEDLAASLEFLENHWHKNEGRQNRR